MGSWEGHDTAHGAVTPPLPCRGVFGLPQSHLLFTVPVVVPRSTAGFANMRVSSERSTSPFIRC
eukprot:NODE_12246_length_237_cov_45.696809_g10476_i0.p3 GENE.NODE_12246_length_237_cov_45.696809_g10476_i0~~NODE_12246_length_237_cov_45.696809_g10476_i0.p3  ORF type:complete len:71 (-),score=8.69 NODE_12246_length_237_cov_45.696809_g10476_i0:23-214(-)